jgi:dTDP-4-amino-4,6-dideoxygalactose transaminase
MKRLDKMNLMRKNASKYYDSQLRNIQGIVTPSLSHDKENSFHLYVIKIKPEYGISRDRLFEKLTESGIRTSVHYKPLQMFSIFRKKAKWYEKPKTSRKLYEEIISLPMFSSITQKEQDLVINCIKNNQK